jgi:hypothetical protein
LSEVAAVILVDDVEISISRILKENWVKTWIRNYRVFWKRWNMWDGVPMQQNLSRKVSKILDESV